MQLSQTYILDRHAALIWHTSHRRAALTGQPSPRVSVSGKVVLTRLFLRRLIKAELEKKQDAEKSEKQPILEEKGKRAPADHCRPRHRRRRRLRQFGTPTGNDCILLLLSHFPTSPPFNLFSTSFAQSAVAIRHRSAAASVFATTSCCVWRSQCVLLRPSPVGR